MAKILFISVLILLTFYSKATKQREELSDSNARQDMTLHHVHELFPRVCGMHGWKKCGRRRSSVKVERIFSYVLNIYLIVIYVFHFLPYSPTAEQR